MKFTFILSENAKIDVEESYEFYERASQGLGERFILELENVFDKILLHPKYYGYCDQEKRFRDFSMKSFPSQIVFEINEDLILIIRVHHASKHPNKRFR